MLDLVVVNSPQSLLPRDRVKIGGRWEEEASRRAGTERTKEGLSKRKLLERKRWEETTKLTTDSAENPRRGLRERVKLIPQFMDEAKVSTLSEERWMRSRKREREKEREEQKEKESVVDVKEGEGLSLNSILLGMKRLRPVRRRLLAPGRRAGVRLGGGEETKEDEKRGLRWGRRGSSAEKVRVGGVSDKSKERRKLPGESSEERRDVASQDTQTLPFLAPLPVQLTGNLPSDEAELTKGSIITKHYRQDFFRQL